MNTFASAPGKIILFGEHAVVYNRPALAVPVTQVHADVEVLGSPRAGIFINAPGIDLYAELDSLPVEYPICSVILRLFQRFEISRPPDLEINISSSIPVASGLGSGAAVSVALTRALLSYLSRSFTDDEVNSLVFEIEKLHHGTPSGIDNTVITYNKPVYFIKGQPVETFKVGKPFTVVIGDTGVSALTKESVGDVRRSWLRDTAVFENYFDEIAQIALIARRSIEHGKPELLGELMDQNHALLQRMTVSSPELDKLVDAARKAGALGAKLSGGGRGGNMIALVEQDKAEAVANALISAGAKRTIITEIS
ncbi:mevalonate kinase [Candidatus Villigracilis saccharophilus]|uniref:mevalonate kinase n=1 Tax=Candidatus Villigracilis saccharophilus TaxID=3140684 RepID=UPI003135FD7D|nr:mevalonate kinase [Anaerolineales bacterium]